ncbi:hypothetical protein Taro_011876 [Colocasia esculenta]|uniref:Uncharacterized protein n=1 Tax=Colocasia esculenta TaxID=4460 RepID=A0A843UHF3_COLES|nr:hypothetical protein [Colocasia esculenta]
MVKKFPECVDLPMGCVDTLPQTGTKDFWEGSLVSTLLDPVSTPCTDLLTGFSGSWVVMRNQRRLMGQGKSDEQPPYEELTV